MRILILVSLLAVALVGCATPESIYLGKPFIQSGAKQRREDLIGKWLGEAPVKGGGSKMWLSERSSDGTYVITVRVVSPKGEVELRQE